MTLTTVRCQNRDCQQSGSAILFETLADDVVYYRDRKGDLVLLGSVLFAHCRRCGTLWRNPKYPNHEALLKAIMGRPLPPASD